MWLPRYHSEGMKPELFCISRFLLQMTKPNLKIMCIMVHLLFLVVDGGGSFHPSGTVEGVEKLSLYC